MTCAAGDRAAPSSGYTLAELLTVIAIISTLAGLSLGVFATLPGKVAHETTAASIRALLRRARASAIESRAEASVTFVGRRVEARAWTPLLLLRFDDVPLDDGVDPSIGAGLLGGAAPAVMLPLERTTGARGAVGRIVKAEATPGKFGGALRFEMPGAYLDMGSAPLYEARAGLRLEAWIEPGDLSLVRDPPDDGVKHPVRPAAPGRTGQDLYEFQVAGKGKCYSLRVREDFALVGSVMGPGARAPVERESRPGVLSPGRWSEVALHFDGEDISLWADGFRVDLAPPRGERRPTEVAGDPRPFVVSSEDPGLTFLGAIDEVRLYGIAAEEGIDVAEDVEVTAPAYVRFDARGTLDALAHEGPQRVQVRRIVRASDPKAAKADASREGTITIQVERTGALR